MANPRFTVPSPDKIANPLTDANPASVAEWVGRLPYADPASVSECVRQALVRLNRHPGKISARADIMAHFRLPCSRLLKISPEGAQTLRNHELRQLMIEMAHGYKHVANDWLQQHSWLQNRKRLASALYFAAKYLSLEIFLAFEAYQCKPSNSWRELQAIYRLAEQQNLHHQAAPDRDQANADNATVSHVLKRILLLRLLDPCHLPPGEARICFGYFSDWAAYAKIENIAALENPAGRYLLDLDSMSTPQAPDPDTLPNNAERFRYFNLLPVSKKAHHMLRRLESGDAARVDSLFHAHDPVPLLKRMLRTWHGRQERRSEREEAFGWLLCGFGLGAVSYYLHQFDKPQNDSEEDNGFSAELAEQAPDQPRPSRYTQIRCRQVNRSNSGICIRLSIPSDALPQVGQVLLLQQDSASAIEQPLAGIARRLQRVDSDTIEIGIQFIRGAVNPIEVRVMGASGPFQPGLWHNAGNPRMSTLLVTRGLYERGKKFIIQGGQPSAVIEADQLVESTANFERFRYLLRTL